MTTPTDQRKALEEFSTKYDAYMALPRHDADCHCVRCLAEFEQWLKDRRAPQ